MRILFHIKHVEQHTVNTHILAIKFYFIFFPIKIEALIRQKFLSFYLLLHPQHPKQYLVGGRFLINVW